VLEIWEEKTWEYYQWRICQTATVSESVSSSRACHSLH